MGQLFSNFGVNWELLLAQAVNFFILLFLLKKFAYQPILNVLRNRKNEIEEGIKMSAEAKDTLANIKKLQEEKMLEAEKKALAMVNTAEATAGKRADTMIEEAKKKSDALYEGAQKTIEQERNRMSDEVSNEAKMMIRMGIEKVIGKMDWKETDEALVRDALTSLKSVSRS